jgi:transmembrane sensor
MQKEQNDIDNLIAQWLAGDLSDEKKRQLDSLVRMHPEKAEELKRLEAMWTLTGNLEAGNLETQAEDDFELRWKKISRATKDQPSIRMYYRLAASLAAIIVISTFITLWIRAGQIVVSTPNAMTKTVVLPDNSSVVINSASSMQYNPRMWFFRRTVYLEGEAFFKVVNNGAPFVVTTALADTRVLGTSFNVKERNERISVICLTGKVKVSLQAEENAAVELEKGSQCESSNGRLAKTTNVADVSVPDWTVGKLSFSHAPLREVFDEISRKYDVAIKYAGGSDATFSGTFEGDSAEEVLKIVCLSAGLTYSKEGSAYKIR